MTAAETQLLLVRAVLLILLYAFLGGVALVVWLDFRRAGRPGVAAVSGASTPAARLIVLDPGGSDRPPGSSLPLAPVTSIGRDLDNEVVLHDATVSGRHAVVLRRDGAWWVEDLGSTNGSFLNGDTVRPELPALVRSGDTVQFGAVRLRLVSPEGP